MPFCSAALASFSASMAEEHFSVSNRRSFHPSPASRCLPSSPLPFAGHDLLTPSTVISWPHPSAGGSQRLEFISVSMAEELSPSKALLQQIHHFASNRSGAICSDRRRENQLPRSGAPALPAAHLASAGNLHGLRSGNVPPRCNLAASRSCLLPSPGVAFRWVWAWPKLSSRVLGFGPISLATNLSPDPASWFIKLNFSGMDQSCLPTISSLLERLLLSLSSGTERIVLSNFSVMEIVLQRSASMTSRANRYVHLSLLAEELSLSSEFLKTRECSVIIYDCNRSFYLYIALYFLYGLSIYRSKCGTLYDVIST